MLENQGHSVLLVRGNRSLLDLFVVNHEINGTTKKKKKKQKLDYKPDEIWITSLFTYWINDVKKSVTHYKTLFPDSTIVAKMAVIEGEFKKNAEIIVKYQERQKFLEGSHNALSELLKEKDEVEE